MITAVLAATRERYLVHKVNGAKSDYDSLHQMRNTREPGVLRSKTFRAATRRYRVRAGVGPSQDQHWLETWLPRLSHFAQFGLFVFTLVFSYFTVLPVYQKSVLEEAVAKKEIELAALNKSLDRSYAKLRTYAMRDFYIEAMPACGGLFIERKSTSEIASEKPRAERVFDLDVPTCLEDLANRIESIAGLTSHDRQVFGAALDRVCEEIRQRRQRALLDYDSVALRVTDSDWADLPSNSYRVQGQQFIEKLRGGAPDMVARRKIAQAIAKEKVGTAYEDFIRDRVSSLRKINWESP